jgi:hypothetical protein
VSALNKWLIYMNMSGGPVEVLETLFAIYMNCHCVVFKGRENLSL